MGGPAAYIRDDAFDLEIVGFTGDEIEDLLRQAEELQQGNTEHFLYDACVNILALTKGAVYVCMSSSELHTLEKAFREAGGPWSTFVIWAGPLLVRRARSGRWVIREEARLERSPPDDEAR